MAAEEIASFADKYGEIRVINKTQGRLRVKRKSVTPALAMNREVSRMIGVNIREARRARGWKLEELALRAGMASGNPKDRIWAIENATRDHGMRMGTVYAIAFALGVEITSLMPSVAQVAEAAKVRDVPVYPFDGSLGLVSESTP